MASEVQGEGRGDAERDKVHVTFCNKPQTVAMNINELKEILKSIGTITFSKHFHLRYTMRGITEREVQSYLRNPEALEYFEYQGEEPEGKKYALIFNKSNKYDLKVVVSIKEALNVVTAHIQSKRKRKVLDKWLKMQK